MIAENNNPSGNAKIETSSISIKFIGFSLVLKYVKKSKSAFAKVQIAKYVK